MQLLQLLVLVGPCPGVGGGVYREHFFVVFDERVDGVLRQFECDLVLRNHVDMDNIGLDVN